MPKVLAKLTGLPAPVDPADAARLQDAGGGATVEVIDHDPLNVDTDGVEVSGTLTLDGTNPVIPATPFWVPELSPDNYGLFLTGVYGWEIFEYAAGEWALYEGNVAMASWLRTGGTVDGTYTPDSPATGTATLALVTKTKTTGQLVIVNDGVRPPALWMNVGDDTTPDWVFAFPVEMAIGDTDNAVLRADGTGGDKVQASALSVEDAQTTTQARVQIKNNHPGQTNSGIVITPLGNGAFIIGPPPDGLATGGNARGAYAVDLDMTRAAATDVASGEKSFKAGNSRAAASGVNSVVLASAGTGGVASGGQSIVAATGSYGQGGGTASGPSSASIANIGGAASGICSFVGGVWIGAASAEETVAMGGFGAHAHLANMHAQGVTDWDSNGINRNSGSMSLRWFTTTTNATQTELGIYRAAFRRAVLRTHESWSGILTVQGLRSGSADWGSAHYQIHITRGASTVSATINQLGSNMGSNAGDLPTGWAIDVDADTTNHALRIRVTGVAATTIRWNAYLNGGLIRHDA